MPPSAPPRAARLALAGAGLLALLGVVAAASRGGLGHSSNGTTSHTYTSYAVTIFLIVLFAAAPFAIYVFVLQQREVLTGGRRKSFPRRVVENTVAVVLVLLAIYLIVRVRGGHWLFHRAATAIHSSGSRLPRPLGGAKGATGAQAQFEWPALWVALALAAVAGALVLWRRRRARAAAEAPPSVTDDLVATIGDAIDDLEAEPDARRAVIAAYARMEGVLARHGARRDASETPLEYLRRVLGSLHARPEPVERLTALFEQAKFSRREIDTAMKREAIGSLRSIRDDLGRTGA